MTDETTEPEPNGEALLTPAVADDALEAAARPVAGAAMSFPNAPTVSILFACCGNN